MLNNWEMILSNASMINTGFIVLEHDLFQESVQAAVGYILPDGQAHQPSLTIQPVIQCLGLQPSDAYLETNDNSSNPLPFTSGKHLADVAAFTRPDIIVIHSNGSRHW